MFRHILAPVRLTELDRACVSAQGLAKAAGRLARDCDASLTLVTITPQWVTKKDADHCWPARRWFEARAAAGLEALQARARHPGCRTLSRWGSAPGSILDIAEARAADAIVVSAPRPAFLGIFHRPDAIDIAAQTCCSVLIVR